MCFLACSFGVSAQDTITFEWAADCNYFFIQATNGEDLQSLTQSTQGHEEKNLK